MSYSRVADHLGMVFDDHRNGVYEKAIAASVNADSVVLDLGSGVGVLGLLALKHGAKRVYMVDPSPVVRGTEQLAADNGFGGQVVALQGQIEDIELPEKVDVILSVFTGNFLLSEELLPSLFYARDKFLKPGGVLVPDLGVMEMALVSSDQIYQSRISDWSNLHKDLDFSSLTQFAVNSQYIVRGDRDEFELLSQPEDLHEIDLMTADKAECHSKVNFTVDREGICHGLQGWFRMKLVNDWLSTSPDAEPTHWSQIFFPLPEPLAVKLGQILEVEIHKPEYGDWSWLVKHDDTIVKQTTFFSTPRSGSALLQRTPGFVPQLGLHGQATARVLSLMSEGLSIGEIETKLLVEFPSLFERAVNPSHFVRQIVGEFHVDSP